MRLYERGYVRVSSLFAPGGFERLLSAASTTDVQKKTGLGRAAAATMTMGMSLGTTNKRGDVWLTIVTDTDTHILHAEPPSSTNQRAAKQIEGACQALMQRESAGSGPTDGAADDTIGARLRRLEGLRSQGTLTEEEYSRLRSRILEDL